MIREAPAVLQHVLDHVGVIELNRPDKFNCGSSAIVQGMAAALDTFEADPAIRVLLLRANGKNFCTGADLDEVLAARLDVAKLAAFIAAGHGVLRRLEASPKPVVCAVQGLALAGGLEILMACDVVFAADTARIGDQHARYGLSPGWGGTQRLPRLVGLRRALELMFSARWLDAGEAERWGLVNYVVPEARLREESLAYAARIAEGSPDGLAFMKRVARRGLEMTLDQGLQAEAAEVPHALRTANVDEGLAAFQARRKPAFK
jgi:enoyl-CoA hydratase